MGRPGHKRPRARTGNITINKPKKIVTCGCPNFVINSLSFLDSVTNSTVRDCLQSQNYSSQTAMTFIVQHSMLNRLRRDVNLSVLLRVDRTLKSYANIYIRSGTWIGTRYSHLIVPRHSDGIQLSTWAPILLWSFPPVCHFSGISQSRAFRNLCLFDVRCQSTILSSHRIW